MFYDTPSIIYPNFFHFYFYDFIIYRNREKYLSKTIPITNFELMVNDIDWNSSSNYSSPIISKDEDSSIEYSDGRKSNDLIRYFPCKWTKDGILFSFFIWFEFKKHFELKVFFPLENYSIQIFLLHYRKLWYFAV